ncbi:hypothetical protein [Butyrivibrio sp.]|uniref:hypothetical protein n=1 Tax=Butyrivibrio sp. TaxID=28121 RepID=UPI0025BEC034|nr:hypothetical protein [Butyrivibrio sp.]MBE5837512.1 hypothetical protein [Butyrivibrio sp.]
MKKYYFVGQDEVQGKCGWSAIFGPWRTLLFFFQKRGKLHNALKENGALYASFKYGEGTTFRGERKFSDFTEKSVIPLFETAGFEIVSNDVESDSRPGRESEKWVNVIGIAR